MSNLYSKGRQTSLFLEQVVDYQDLTTGLAKMTPSLPVGAIPLRVIALTEVAFTGGGVSAATLSVGNSGATTKYLNGYNLFSGTAVSDAVVTTGLGVGSAPEVLVFTPTFTGGTPTAGKARVIIEYIIAGRTTETN